MAFTTDAQTLQDLSDALQAAGTTALPSQATNINTESHAWAYNQIVSALTGRGFTIAQILTWDRGSEVERTLSKWRNFITLGLGQTLDKQYLDSLDVREEMKCCVVTASSAPLTPGGTIGIASSGEFDTSKDLFVWPPNDGTDPRPGEEIGETTRW